MKNNFFEVFNEIDEKYIGEAANSGCEDCRPEEMGPVRSGRRLFPAIVKYAACFVLVVAAAFAAYKAAGSGNGGSLLITPLASDYITENTEEAAETEEPEDAAETENTAEETSDFTQDFASQSTDSEEEAKKEADRKDWQSRTLASPADAELPEYYYPEVKAFSGRMSGWASMVIPAPQGSAVRAISYGEVVFADYQQANAYHAHNEYIVVIKHNDHGYSAYSTIAPETTLQAGDTVEAGQRIGYVDYRLFDGDGEYGFVFYVGATNFAEG